MNIGSNPALYPTSPSGASAASGPVASALPSDEATSGMRMATPVFRTYLDLSASRRVYQGVRDFNGGFRSLNQYNQAGGFMRGSASSLEGGMRSLPHLLRGNFVFSALMSGVTNLLDLLRGKETPQQAFGAFCADTAAYTAIGSTATLLGGLLGSFIPGIGTLVGIAVGAGVSMLLGNFYEHHLRPQLSQTVTQSIQSMMTPRAPAQA